MALTFTTSGYEISTEDYYIQAVSDAPSVTSVQIRVYIQGLNSNDVIHTVEHAPDSGTTDTFTFEVNQILKAYFDWQFHDLNSTTEFTQLNVLASIMFVEYDGNVEVGLQYTTLNLKNMTFSPMELNDLDLSDYDMSSGTDNKFLTSSPSELEVPDKRLSWLSILKSQGVTYAVASPSQIGTPTYANQDYLDIVNGGNGFMYIIPFNASGSVSDILKFNPSTGATTPIATGGVSVAAYAKGIKASNGKIYCIPYNETRAMVIDPTTDGVSFITGAGAGTQKYINACEISGRIYCSPFNNVPILTIITGFEILSIGAINYSGYGDCVAVNSLVYFMPISSGNILKYHINFGAVGTITLASYQFLSSTFYNSTNGFIYAIPSSVGTDIIKIDVSTDIITTFGSFTAGDYQTASIGGDGKIYAIGYNSNSALSIDMSTDTTNLISPISATTGPYFIASDTLDDGNIYALPNDPSLTTNDYLKITIGALAALQELVVESFNTAGVSLGEVTHDIIATQRAPINPLLGTETPDIYDIFVQPIEIDSANNQKTVKAWVRDKTAPFTIRSEIKTFVNHNYGLSYCNGFRIHWLNEFGCQDSYTFNGRLVKTLESDVKDYQNVNIGTLVYFSTYSDVWELTTREESPEVIEWLSKMLRNRRAALEQLIPNANPAYFDIEILDSNSTYYDNLNQSTEFSLKFRFSKIKRGIQ